MRLFEEWLLLPQRLVLHERTQTAVLADVHLGYAAARQRLGDAIPFRTSAEELQPLDAAARCHSIRELIVAGDLFEGGYDAAIYQDFLDVLKRLGIRLVALVPGNHDGGVETAGAEVPLFPDGVELAGWRIVHGDQPGTIAQPTIMGHHHPATRWQGGKRPCFLARPGQLILPAFSLDAAGVDVSADPRWADCQICAIVGNHVQAR